MSNPNKARGTRFETAVVTYLKDNGIDATRKVQKGTADEGDIEVRSLSDVVIQAKDQASFKLAEWMDATHHQALAAKATFPFVVFKRRGKGVGQAYVLTDLESFADLMADLLEGRQAIETLDELAEWS